MSLTGIIRSTFTSFALVAFLFTFDSIAQAQVSRTFVSNSGLDNRLCDRGNPCRAIQAAISAVGPGGEVSVLSSGEYEPFVIDKSVRIIAPEGVQASVVAKTGNAITINIAASDVVLIRGLSLDGSKTASTGIRVSTTGATGVLHVEKCVISNFKFNGLTFSATSGHLYLVETTARDNTQNGIVISGQVHALIDRCRVEENGLSGMHIQLGARATIRDSIASGNSAGGDTETGGFNSVDGVLSIENCITSNNANGIRAEGGLVQVSNTLITDNAAGVLPTAGGQVVSFGNNRLRANGVNGNFTLVIGQR